MLWRGVTSKDHPVLAHIIPMRRCNLACAYCNEYDDVSKPVPLATMVARLDRLAALGTTVVAISGGEPLLHPELDEIIAHIRKRGMMTGMITNGYLLTAERIQRLNRAGLEHIQISIDNVMPDDVSKKSLKVLDKKLQLLAENAEFHVNINSVVGGGIRNPQDALTVGKRAVELGFSSTVGIIHDGDGQLRPLSDEECAVYLETKKLGRGSYGKFNSLQDNIAHGKENEWRCQGGRALSVYLRGRAGALLLAAARLSGHTARKVHSRGHSPGVCDGEVLRSPLHGGLRPLHVLHGFLALAADAALPGRYCRFGPDQVGCRIGYAQSQTLATGLGRPRRGSPITRRPARPVVPGPR
jgi:hypothetical protein